MDNSIELVWNSYEGLLETLENRLAKKKRIWMAIFDYELLPCRRLRGSDINFEQDNFL